ncbi:MAG: hypothetical protein BRC31_08080 [Actinobacteria bacterium QS_5_72_10]|nr:MAG: hypothetical protein BRC31_08080 [Actinobacteria bacterium QS_5_72_10]
MTVAACSDSEPPRSAATDGDSPVASPQAAATPGELGDAESFGGQTAPAEANGDDGGMAQSGWNRLTPSGSPRTEVAAAAHLDKVWAVGGLDGDGAASADVDVYAPTFDAWEPGPPLPRAVHHAAVVAHDDDLLVVGGYVGDGFDTPTDAVWRLDSATGRWQPSGVAPSRYRPPRSPRRRPTTPRCPVDACRHAIWPPGVPGGAVTPPNTPAEADCGRDGAAWPTSWTRSGECARE